jgi:hypothetical protein
VNKISYTIYDPESDDVLRLVSKPKSITINGKVLVETKDINKTGWTWKPLDKGGVLKIMHSGGENIDIML